jgi:hypothetical protein
MAISTYGPYYESKIQSREKTKKALTGQGYTPEELAGATYGELMARYKDAEVRRQQEIDTELREQGLGLQQQQLGLQGRQLRNQERAVKSAERGEMVSGIATGVNVLDKIGALKWGGDVLKTGSKAISGVISPQPAVTGGGAGIDYSGMAGGVEDIWSGVDYGGGSEDIWTGVDYGLVGSGEDFYTSTSDTITTSIGEGTVICTELYRQGLLDEKTYLADSAYGDSLDDDILIGYRIWGEGVARLMRKSKAFTKLVSIFAIPWAKEMAFQMGILDKGHWLGKAMNIVGIPICRFIGRLIIGGGELCPRTG